LDDSADTRTNLLATLDRVPALAGSARSAGQIFHQAVNPGTGQVAVMAADGIGLELYDGATLHRIAVPEKLVGGSVAARPDGQGYAVSISGDLLEDGPPILMLDRTGARSAVQLGGSPAGYHVVDLGFPRRTDLGFSPTSRWFTATMIHSQQEKPPHTFVWDLRSPQRPVAALPLLPSGSTPTISRDGRTLFTTNFDETFPPRGGSLLVTDVPSGKTRRTLTAADLGVVGIDDVLAQSPDGRTLAVGAGVEVVLVDTATLKPRDHLSGQGPTQGLAFSPDGTLLAASGERLMVWDVSGDEPVEILSNDGEVDDPAFSGDGKTLYTKTTAGLVQSWDLVGDRRFLASRPGEHLDLPDPFGRFSPDQSKVGYVNLGPKFRVRDVATGKLGPEIAPTMGQGDYNDIAWHPDSTTLNITSGDPWVRTWDSTTGRQLAERRLAPLPSTEAAAIAFFSLDGKYLLVGSTEGRLHVLDARTLVPTREPIQVYEKASGEPDAQDLWNFAPSGDLHTVWISDSIVDYIAGTARPMPDLGFPVVDLKPSPDGKRLLVNTGPTGIGLLNAITMRWIARPSAAQAGLMGYYTGWSGDGSLVASAEQGHLSYWDGLTGARLGTVTVTGTGDPAFSRDGKRLLYAGTDGSVLSWDLDPRSWIAAACRLAGRALTEQEWHTYLPDRPFQSVCQS
jgi:WD40 repeat protein